MWARRDLSWWHDDDGTFVLRARLAAEEGALVLAALEVARAALEDPGASAEDRPRAADALVALARTALEHGPAPAEGADHCRVVVHVEDDGRAWVEPGVPISSETARRLGCEATVVAMYERDGEPLNLGRASRQPSVAQRRAVRRRDGACRFPGCAHRRWTQVHHVWPWSAGGPTDLDNLVLLCWRHHHAVHEGGWSLTGTARRLVFRRPDGTVVPESPPAILATGPDLVEQHAARGLSITPDTPMSLWDGWSVDYADAVEGLCWLEERAAATG